MSLYFKAYEKDNGLRRPEVHKSKTSIMTSAAVR